MKNKLLLVSCIVLPFTALANTINDIKELRAKIKETSEEIRIVFATNFITFMLILGDLAFGR